MILREPALGKGCAAFQEFSRLLAEKTAAAFPAFESVWAKWDTEDLIPFLSDFDSRLVCRPPVRAEHWVELDRIVGEIHLSTLLAHPEWARIMEHTPGVAVTIEEMLDERIFHPETQQWTSYGDESAWRDELRTLHTALTWSDRHEFYFLKRFLYYYSPYQRGIDPPINLGPYEFKYGLHSRFWHYFVPALQAGLALANRRTVRGKFETLKGWLEYFPGDPVLKKARAAVESHYECEELADESKLARLEEDLFQFLQKVMDVIKPRVTIIDMLAATDIGGYHRQLAAFCSTPLMMVYDGVRFSRIRKGRYTYYLNSPPFFDASRLIASEMKWLRHYFTEPLFKAYAQIRYGSGSLSINAILTEMQRALIDAADRKLVERVFTLAYAPDAAGREVAIIRETAAIYADYHIILERILADALACTPASVRIGEASR